MRRKYHGGNSASLPLVETVGPFPPGFTRTKVFHDFE
jgi:hypothetical protein